VQPENSHGLALHYPNIEFVQLNHSAGAVAIRFRCSVGMRGRR
jgi:hypothetical protein